MHIRKDPKNPNNGRSAFEKAPRDAANSEDDGIHDHPDAVINVDSFLELIRNLHKRPVQSDSAAEQRAIWGVPSIMRTDRAAWSRPAIERLSASFASHAMKGTSRKGDTNGK